MQHFECNRKLGSSDSSTLREASIFFSVATATAAVPAAAEGLMQSLSNVSSKASQAVCRQKGKIK